MKPITMLILKMCPYCKEAFAWMEELKQEEPKYLELQVNVIDERLNPDKAKEYDYYYVPTYFVGDEKVHEGIPSKEIIRGVFEKAYNH